MNPSYSAPAKTPNVDGVMFNAYPDSCGGKLHNIVELFNTEEFSNAFSYFYILPSLFKSDLDRGFSIVSYNLNQDLGTENDLSQLQQRGIRLKLDFILNHLSAQSHEFLDVLKHGDDSEYVDFFIDWNEFWKGKGLKNNDGYIIPEREYLDKLFMRKPELPILKVPFPDGTYRFFWNTFYQEKVVSPPSPEQLKQNTGLSNEVLENVIKAMKKSLDHNTVLNDMDFAIPPDQQEKVLDFIEKNCVTYLGQMDLNAESAKVWKFYDKTLGLLKKYGAQIVRLDAFAYLHKAPGLNNFFNEPGTWEYLSKLRDTAQELDVFLLPEIHAKHEENVHKKLADNGFMFYDFFFPGILIHTLETGSKETLIKWITEICENDYKTVNMLGCHDGIPLLDVIGLLTEQTIDSLIDLLKSRGGRVKNLYGPDGTKISYYQVNATFFSALGENEKKFLLARAIQMFMPGIPQIWYLDLFGGKNDYMAADKDGHKEINRTNLTNQEIEQKLKTPFVQNQLHLLKFRNTYPAFGFDSKLTIQDSEDNKLVLKWSSDQYQTQLTADLNSFDFQIVYMDNSDHQHSIKIE